jgi:hypothetical protein
MSVFYSGFRSVTTHSPKITQAKLAEKQRGE